MPRFRASRATLFLSTLLAAAVLLLFFADNGRLDYTHHEQSGSSSDGSPVAQGQERAGSDGVGPVGGLLDRPWSFFSSNDHPVIVEGLEYSRDGLVRGWDKIHSVLTSGTLGRKDSQRVQTVAEKHPIVELMERGRKRWDGLLKRQSKTLPQAVAEYKKRYGRLPPRGFEVWWQFCKRNGVKIVDDYDQIEHDIAPFFALSPEEVQRRIDDLKDLPHSYQMTFSPTKPSTISGPRSTSPRPIVQFNMLEPLAPFLPGDVTIYASDHDMGNYVLPHALRQAALDAVAEGKYLTTEQLNKLENGPDYGLGLISACATDSPARQQTGFDEINSETSFVFDPKPGQDFCETPDLLHNHGAFSFHHRRGSQLRPVFHMSKLAQNGEFLLTPLEGYHNFTSDAGQSQTASWNEKTVDKLFWRGSATGDAYSKRPDYSWRESHRPRLHFFATNTEGESTIWVQRGKTWEREVWSNAKLNEKYLDIGLIGKPHQCKKEDGTCDEMATEIKWRERVAPEDAVLYKYVFDMDGNGWSSRYHRLLMSGSVVIKATIYPEWMSDWLTPWVHYIPCKMDLSDVYDIMSFFVGSPDGRTKGNDALARQIAEQAQQFGTEHWRWEDMQAYMFRQILEYARLAANDRDEWSYQKSPE